MSDACDYKLKIKGLAYTQMKILLLAHADQKSYIADLQTFLSVKLQKGLKTLLKHI